MAEIEKTISAIPEGIVNLHLYESPSISGLYPILVIIPVTVGQTSISFDATDGYFYKFKLEDLEGLLSNFSSIWQNVTDERTCLISGQCLDPEGTPVESVTITATLLAQNTLSGADDEIAGTVSSVTDNAGIWGLTLLRTSLFTDAQARYRITFSGQGFNKSYTVIVPDTETALLSELAIADSLSLDYDLSFELEIDSLTWRLGDKKYLACTVSDAESTLSILPGCTAKIWFSLVGAASPILDWADAEVEENIIRYLYDSTAQSAGSYQVQFQLTGANSEQLHSAKFRVRFKTL
jgi:hypothetical protein